MGLKIIAIILALILISNLTFFVLKIISPYIFWAVIIAVAVIAYKVLPAFKKQQ